MFLSKWLRPLRLLLAVIVLAVMLAAFLDYRDFLRAWLKHPLAAVQFVPSALTLAHGGGLALLGGGAALATLLATLLFGRVYCSAVCPLGILQDVILRVARLVRRLFGAKGNAAKGNMAKGGAAKTGGGYRQKPIPYRPAHNVLRYGILALTLLAVGLGWGGLALAWLDPYSQWGRIAAGVFRPPVIFANNLVADAAQTLGSNAVPRVGVPWAGWAVLLPPLLIFTAIAVLSAWRGRLYCNTVCPVGALLSLLSRHSLFRLGIDASRCVKCGSCLRVCKAQCIELKSGAIDFSRCVACYNCVSACDERGVHYRLAWFRRGKATAKTEPGEGAKTGAAEAASTSVPPGSAAAPQPDSPLNPDRRTFLASTAIGLFACNVRPLRAAAGALGAAASSSTTGSLSNAVPTDPAAYAPVVSPPGSGSASAFLASCTACQLCVSACPSHLLEPAYLEYERLSGFMKPRLNFQKSFCNFNCTACGHVCPTGAIRPLTLPEKKVARIGVACVTLANCIVIKDGTSCGACAEHCPTAALQMEPQRGADGKVVPGTEGQDIPVVHAEYCIGCGACQYACPARPQKAVVIHGLRRHQTADILVQEKLAAPTGGDFPF